MRHSKLTIAFVLSAAAPFLAAQAPRFEVASVRPDPIAVIESGGRPHTGVRVEGTHVDIGGATLTSLIMTAYSVRGDQISGPSWLSAQRFDILASMPPDATQAQLPQLLQSLLQDRFKMTARRVSKEQAAYALVIGKGGAKLEQAAADAAFPPAPDAPLFKGPRDNPQSISGTIAGGPNGPFRLSVSDGGAATHMEFARIPIKGLADMLTTMLGRPVLDRTGLEGTYHLTLDYATADTMGGARMAADRAQPGDAATPVASLPSGTSVLNAVEKLGLKLESTRGSVEQIVIDHIERTPTDN